MQKTSFYYRSEKYIVTESLGESKTDKDYFIYKGKKENGRKTITVKIDCFNGQCLKID